MQDRQQHDRDRLAEVECLCRTGQDRRRLPEIGVQVGAPPVRVAGQQRPGVQQHGRVVVDIADPRRRGQPLGNLVGVLRGGKPGSDVEELADPRLGDQEPHRPGEERAVVPGPRPQAGECLQRPFRGLPVRRVIVLAAEQVVVDP